MNQWLKKPSVGCFVSAMIFAGSVAVAQQPRESSQGNETSPASDAQAAETTSTAAYLGITVDSVPPAVAAQLGDRLQANHGVLVADVAEDSPAAKAGIRTHDILVSYNGQQLASPSQLASLVREDAAGSTVKVKLLRDGEPREIDVTLGKRPAATAPARGEAGPRLPRWFSRRAPGADGRFGQSDQRESVWTSFESFSLKSLDGDRYRVQISYATDDGTTQQHTYEGTREEIRREIENHEALPTEKRQRLLEALDLSDRPSHPGFEGFDLPDDRELFRDLREFEEALRQRLQRQDF